MIESYPKPVTMTKKRPLTPFSCIPLSGLCSRITAPIPYSFLLSFLRNEYLCSTAHRQIEEIGFIHISACHRFMVPRNVRTIFFSPSLPLFPEGKGPEGASLPPLNSTWKIQIITWYSRVEFGGGVLRTEGVLSPPVPTCSRSIRALRGLVIREGAGGLIPPTFEVNLRPFFFTSSSIIPFLPSL
jgi:hypothetical protein